MIQPLEVESQHPARTVNLEEVLVLAADRKARRLERSRAAIRELHQRHHRIVDSTVRHAGSDVGDPLRDATVQIQGRTEKCPGPTAACTPRCSGKSARADRLRLAGARRQWPPRAGS